MSPFLVIIMLNIFIPYGFVTATFDIPVLSPLLGNACQENNVCGKGNCVVSNNSNFGFACHCESGWRQARSQDDDNLSFLPCVVPNCTFNYNCSSAAAPAAGNPGSANMSFFDPCYWVDCGGGTCNKTSLFTRTCLCEEGYYNLFNSSAFPCYQECSIGGDCPDLGLNFPNSTTSRPGSSPSSANDSNSSSSTPRMIHRVKVAWLVTALTAFVMFSWKNT